MINPWDILRECVKEYWPLVAFMVLALALIGAVLAGSMVLL